MENGIYIAQMTENGVTSVHIPEEVVEFARLNERVQERLPAFLFSEPYELFPKVNKFLARNL